MTVITDIRRRMRSEPYPPGVCAIVILTVSLALWALIIWAAWSLWGML